MPTEPGARIALALPLIALAIGGTPRDLGPRARRSTSRLGCRLRHRQNPHRLCDAPVLEKELRFVELRGWIESLEGRDRNLKRLTLRVIALGDLTPAACRIACVLPRAARRALGLRTGDASLKATLQPPPEPVQPGAFDFGRSAWYDSLGGIGYATSRIDRFTPIRKWAAATALVAALLYLGLSGAAVPTVRSSIMTSLVLLAVLLDHPALTMRNVALAAFAILIVAPESLFDPSFQMSFAAVIALITLYEWLARERSPISDVSLFCARLGWAGSTFGARRSRRLSQASPLRPLRFITSTASRISVCSRT